jgi:hypothetical protein
MMEGEPSPEISASAAIDPQPEPESFDIVRRVVDSYRRAATHERLDIEYQDAKGRLSRDTLTMHLDPGAESVDRRLSITLGKLRINAGRGILTAVSEAAAGRVFRSVIDGELSIWAMARALPPLPIPALDFFLASDGTHAPAAITTYAKDVVWDREIERRATTAGRFLVVTGKGTSARVQLMVDPTTFRLHRVDIWGLGDGESWNLACTAHPLPTPGSDPFFAPPEASEVVDSLAELMTAPRAFKPGDRWEGVSLMDSTASAWDMHFAGAYTVMIVYGADAEGAPDIARLRAHDVQAALARSQVSARVVPVVVDSLVSFGGEHSAQRQRQWEEIGLRPAFSVAGRALLERVAPGHDGAVVVLDAQRRIVSLVAFGEATAARLNAEFGALPVVTAGL